MIYLHPDVNILDCLAEQRAVKKGKRQRTAWLWLTNLPITKENCILLKYKEKAEIQLLKLPIAVEA